MTQWGLDTLFNPAKRHMDEEKQRLEAHREEAGDSSGGKRIDFESGKVVIRPAGSDDVDDADDAAAGGDSDAAGDAAAQGGGNGRSVKSPAKSAAKSTARRGTRAAAPASEAVSKPEPTPAQIRAAERRGRRPR